MAIRAEDFNGKNPYGLTEEEILLASADNQGIGGALNEFRDWVGGFFGGPDKKASEKLKDVKKNPTETKTEAKIEDKKSKNPVAKRQSKRPEPSSKLNQTNTPPNGPVTGRSGGAAGAAVGDVVQPEQPQQTQEPVDDGRRMLGGYGGGTHESDTEIPGKAKLGATGWEKDFIKNLQEYGLPWLAKNPTVLAEPNLHPLYAWSDQMFGSNYSKGYQRPEPLLKQIISGFDAAGRYRTSLSEEKSREHQRSADLLRLQLDKNYQDMALKAGAVGKSGKTIEEILGNLEMEKQLIEMKKLVASANDVRGNRRLDNEERRVNALIQHYEYLHSKQNEKKKDDLGFSDKELGMYAGSIVGGMKLYSKDIQFATDRAKVLIDSLVKTAISNGNSADEIAQLIQEAQPAIQQTIIKEIEGRK